MSQTFVCGVFRRWSGYGRSRGVLDEGSELTGIGVFHFFQRGLDGASLDLFQRLGMRKSDALVRSGEVSEDGIDDGSNIWRKLHHPELLVAVGHQVFAAA